METLPLDILLNIIDLLADGDDEGIKSLRTLSQACKYMVPICRKHLFSSLRLCVELNSERFSDLLSKNPDIARYVRNLDYKVHCTQISDHELNILDLLKKRSSLQSIVLSWSSKLDCEWSNLDESTRLSLVSLIQLPTITFLSIYSFQGFPAAALSGCSNLIELRVGRLKLAPPEVNQVISRSKIPTLLYIKTNTYSLAALLNSAGLHAGSPIVDFSRLQKAEFHVESRGDIDPVNELIRVTTRLEYIYMGLFQPLVLAGLGASLAINAYRTLKLLEFCVTVLGDDYNLLCGLNRELGFIAGNNILEVLGLYLVIEDDASCQNDSEDWSALDSVLTESGAFPMLHRVSVEIYWCSESESTDISEQEKMSKILQEDKFPRLVKSKGVKFDFSAHFQYGSW